MGKSDHGNPIFQQPNPIKKEDVKVEPKEDPVETMGFSYQKQMSVNLNPKLLMGKNGDEIQMSQTGIISRQLSSERMGEK